MAKWKSGARGGRPDRGGGGSRGGRGRGNNGRGRGGAGWVLPGPGRGRGRGHSHSGSGSIQDELDSDYTLQTYADAPPPLKSTTEPSARGRGFRGRGRGGPLITSQLSAEIAFPGRGRGFDIPRRYVQGIGAPKDAPRIPVQVGPKKTLSNLLHQGRPLLRPITFVPSTETRFLFQNEEELLQPIVEDPGDTVQSPIPTADRVTRVFSGGNIPPLDVWDNTEDGTEDDIEVVDFNDVGKLFDSAATTSKAAIPKRKTTLVSTIHEELITRNGNKETRPLPTKIQSATEMVDKTLSPPNGVGISVAPYTPVNRDHPFYVDIEPGSVLNELEARTTQQPSLVLPVDGDDDIIVYVAPHPRNVQRISDREKETTEGVTEISTIHDDVQIPVDSSRFSPYERPAALPTLVSNTPLKTSIPTAVDEPLSSVAPTTATTPRLPEPSSFSSPAFMAPNAAETTASIPRLRVPPITTPRQAKLWKSKISRVNKRMGTSKWKTSFGTLGAMREEDLLRRLDGERDARYDERRRGHSDLEWGDSTDDDSDAGEEVVDMKVLGQEPELDADMKRVLGMLEKGPGQAGETLKPDNDDIDDHGMEVDVDVDIATMRRFVRGLTGGDAGKHVTMDDIECEELIRIEDEGDDVEQRGSSGNEDEDDESEGAMDGEEEEALRIEEAKFMHDGGLGNFDGSDDSADDDEDDEDGSFQVQLDRLRAKSMERHVANGGFDNEDDDDLLERNMTWADQDEAFIQQFNDMLDEKGDIKDREYLDWSSSPARRRKDKYKDLPPELRIQFEKDRQKKAEWKRSRELERLATAAHLLSTKKGGVKGRKSMLAAAAVDSTIVVLPNGIIDMTSLVQRIRRLIADKGTTSMSLPPTDKQTRVNIHQIASAFNLKSVSKGKGDARYTTLTKTTKTGIQVNEGKIARIVRRSGAGGDSFILEDKKGKGVMRVPRHREGDVVGMTAPKLDESNVGFRLLAMMGWSEGDRIGASTNGLEVPLAAVIKTSKLGLGAKK